MINVDKEIETKKIIHKKNIKNEHYMTISAVAYARSSVVQWTHS